MSAVAEGWAGDADAADALLVSGAVALAPANESGGVVPMAAVLGPTTPVWVAELAEAGVAAWAPLGQGSGDGTGGGFRGRDGTPRLYPPAA